MLCTSCNHEVKPVVAFDVDGTSGDYHGHLFWFAEQWLGVQGTGWGMTYDGSVDLATFMGIDKHTYRQMKLAYRQGGMKRMMPMFPFADKAIQLCRYAGAEVWITTTRPYNKFDSTDPDTREWLRRHGIVFDGLIYDDDKYDRLVEIVGQERIVGIVDDLPEQWDEANRLGLRPIQHATRYNRAIRRPVAAATLAEAGTMLINRVNKWKEEHG